MSKKMTIIATGQMGGGTTALSGVLQLLGVNMGDERNDSQEDQEMQRASTDYNQILRNAAERNNKYDLWGWKNPNLPIPLIKRLVPELRNPKVIFIFRNPINVWMRRKDHMYIDKAAERNKEMGLYFYDNPEHTEIISYESLLTDKKKTIEKIANIVGVNTADPVMIHRMNLAEEYVQPNAGYGNLDPYLEEAEKVANL